MTAAQAQLGCATDTDSGGGSASARDNGDALAMASAVSLCLLHDLVGAALFLASHPLHAVYLLIFARGLLTVAAFFWPLLASTALLLAVLTTVAPYISGGGAEWHGARSLGKTCGIAVAALCVGLRPDERGGGGGAGLVGQLCSFVLGPGDAASVLLVGEIMGEPCDIAACCLALEEERSLFLLVDGDECKELAFEEPPVMGGDSIDERRFLDYEDFGDLMDEIDEKAVISEYLKGSDSLAEQCCPKDTLFVQEMEAEEEEEGNGIQGQGLILSAVDEVSDGVEEKRLECDPVSVEIKNCEPVQALEIKKLEPVEPMEARKLEMKKSEEMRKCEPVQAVLAKKSEPVESVETKSSKLVQALEVKKVEQVEPLEIRKPDPVEPVEIKKREPVKPRSSIAQRIKLWEAQVSGNVKPVLEAKEENSEKEPIKHIKKCVPFEADPCVDKPNSEQQAEEVIPNEESTSAFQEKEFKDVKEYTTRLETEASSEKCSQNTEAEEIAPAVSQVAEEELKQGCCKDPHPEPEQQEQVHEISKELEEMEEAVYAYVTSSPAMWSESPLKSSTSIAGRVHSRTSSENLVGEGSPSRKDKEWKRTLACKLYEERMQLRLCRDRAVVEGSDNMDMLWEAYEVGGGGGGKGRGGKRGGSKAKGGASSKAEGLVEEGEEEEVEEHEEEEGSVRQLCCLQALKFSTRKMNFGGGKPSLSKISKVLRRMTALSRMGSRRKQSG
ncbi:unnamed protein product [Urochloa decumbens]|uniref:Uncharacterized protein n=1 Tax=Urochloa decumbens TaxID=240449 RepID=A0ABC9B0S2_9POAL